MIAKPEVLIKVVLFIELLLSLIESDDVYRVIVYES